MDTGPNTDETATECLFSVDWHPPRDPGAVSSAVSASNPTYQTSTWTSAALGSRQNPNFMICFLYVFYLSVTLIKSFVIVAVADEQEEGSVWSRKQSATRTQNKYNVFTELKKSADELWEWSEWPAVIQTNIFIVSIKT